MPEAQRLLDLAADVTGLIRNEIVSLGDIDRRANELEPVLTRSQEVEKQLDTTFDWLIGSPHLGRPGTADVPGGHRRRARHESAGGAQAGWRLRYGDEEPESPEEE